MTLIHKVGQGLPFWLLLAGALPSARASLRFEQPTVCRDEVRSGAPLTQTYSFVNDGSEPVQIVEVRPSCGCVLPSLPRRLYQPGEKGTIGVEVNTLAQPPGPHTWKVELRVRRGQCVEEAVVQLSARVVAELTVKPAVLFLVTGGTVGQDVVLTDLRERPLTGLRIGASSDKLSASLQGQGLDPEGHPAFRIHVEVARGCPLGKHDETLDLYTTDPAYSHLRVPVTVVRQASVRLAALPAEVNLETAGQAVASRLVQVRDSKGEPVEVKRVTADDPAIECRWASANGFATVRVQLDASRCPAGGLHSAIHIEVARPAAEVLTVPVRCLRD